MAEPTTAITDFLMAAVALALGLRLIGAWRWAFVFTAIGALAGGLYHSSPSNVVWKITVYAVGLATMFLLIAVSLRVFAVAEFILYAIWMAAHNDFIYVILDYGSGMLLVAAVYVINYSRASKYVLASIAVAAIGAFVQAARISIHPRFNFNDLYHVIQIVSLFLLYRGAIRSRQSTFQPAVRPAPR